MACTLILGWERAATWSQKVLSNKARVKRCTEFSVTLNSKVIKMHLEIKSELSFNLD